ncbi:hypothetical protein IAU60_000594 [Kwoniella sp. DSM 27419]
MAPHAQSRQSAKRPLSWSDNDTRVTTVDPTLLHRPSITEDEKPNILESAEPDEKPVFPDTTSRQKTPKKPRTAKPTKIVNLSSASSPRSLSGSTAKARFAEIIIDAGLKAYDKAQVEAETGLTRAQQTEMLKKGRGSLWKALFSQAAGL